MPLNLGVGPLGFRVLAPAVWVRFCACPTDELGDIGPLQESRDVHSLGLTALPSCFTKTYLSPGSSMSAEDTINEWAI
jgi:hypothetical protein